MPETQYCGVLMLGRHGAGQEQSRPEHQEAAVQFPVAMAARVSRKPFLLDAPAGEGRKKNIHRRVGSPVSHMPPVFHVPRLSSI